MRPLLPLAIGFLLATAVIAQDQPPPPTANAPVLQGARPADVASPEAIVAALYDVISGPAGTTRDWARFHHLFHPEARLAPVSPAKTQRDITLLTPKDYEKKAGPYLEKRGFFETEIHRVIERIGPLVHLYSTYESRHKADDPKPFARGINSIQLIQKGDRWYVLHVVWAEETPTTPIPKKYLP